jgi:hypothetical protein
MEPRQFIAVFTRYRWIHYTLSHPFPLMYILTLTSDLHMGLRSGLFLKVSYQNLVYFNEIV